jgi:hypothetical protein
VNVLERIGSGTIHRLADVGELSIQFWAGLRASPHVLRPGARLAHDGVDGLPLDRIEIDCRHLERSWRHV